MLMCITPCCTKICFLFLLYNFSFGGKKLKYVFSPSYCPPHPLLVSTPAELWLIWLHPCTIRWCLHIPPTHASTVHVLRFAFEVSHRFPFLSHWSIVRPAWVPACRNGPSCALRRLSLISRLSQAFPSPSVVVFHEILPRRSLNKLEFALLKGHVVTVCAGSCTVQCTTCLSHFSQDFKLHSVMVAVAKAAFDFHTSVWFFLVCE